MRSLTPQHLIVFMHALSENKKQEDIMKYTYERVMIMLLRTVDGDVWDEISNETFRQEKHLANFAKNGIISQKHILW